MNRQARRAALIGGTIIATLFASSCVSIPDSGPVAAGRVDVDESSNDLVYLPESPQAGASQDEIVLDFLNAATSPSDDYGIAREYLSADFASRWNPDARVMVRSGQPEVTAGQSGNYTVDLALVAEVDARGEYSTDTEDSAQLSFTLVNEGGEWRISDAPDGIVLSSYPFTTLFREHEVYYLSSDEEQYVPETRWFERTPDTLANRLVDSLLAGPSSWLSGAVTTSANAGVTRVGDVVVDEGSATVTVSFEQLAESSSTRLAQLAAQLQRTLATVGITSVEVQIDQAAGFGASDSQAPVVPAGIVDARPLVLTGETMRFLGSGSETLVTTGSQLAELDATSYATLADGSSGVALANGSAFRVVNGEAPELLGQSAVPPSLDRHGWSWLVPNAAEPTIQVVADGERHDISLPVENETIRSIEVSRDGARLLVVTAVSDETHVYLFGIQRHDGVPSAVGVAYRQPVLEGTGADAAWVSEVQLAVLTTSQGTSSVSVMTIGGGSEKLEELTESMVQISGGSTGTSTIRLLAADGSLWSHNSAGWRRSALEDAVELVATVLG